MEKLHFCLQISAFLSLKNFQKCINRLNDYGELLDTLGELQGYHTTKLFLENSKYEDEYRGKRKAVVLSYTQLQVLFDRVGITKTRLKEYDNDIEIKNIIESGKLLLGLIRNSKKLFEKEETIRTRIIEIKGVQETLSRLKNQLSLFLEKEIGTIFKEQKGIV